MTTERTIDHPRPTEDAGTATPVAPARAAADAHTRASDAHDDAASAASPAPALAPAPAPVSAPDPAQRDAGPAPREVLARQRRRFGGVKVGSALFGWIAATGTATVLVALVAAIGAALGYDAVPTWIGSLDLDAGTLGWIGGAVLLVVIAVSYFSGGFVAGRMARFDGAVQGVAVWTWSLVIGIVAGLASVLLDGRYEIFRLLSTLPRVPLSDGEVTLIGLVAAGIAAVVSLGAAVLGGLAGTRFHRRVDRVALGG